MNSSKLNIVVTGGAGFIGSHLIDKLLEEGNRVINIDNFDSFYSRKKKSKNIKRHHDYETYKLIELDVRDKEVLGDEIPDDTDVIVHLAAKAGVRPSIKDPVLYNEVNVTGTQNMLEIAKEKNIKQFIFASSSSVYGENPNVPWREDDYNLKPISPYASTKISGELMGHVYSHLYGIRFLALRFFTVYGPRQRPDLAIYKFLTKMSSGEEIQLYGDGTTRRDYTYVNDIVDGIIEAIQYKDSMFEVINLGNNQTVELLDLVSAIETASGISANKVFTSEQPGDVKQTWASLDKAERMFKYEPNYSLKKGLKEFTDWFQQQRN